MIKTIIFDIGNVLAGFEWKEYFLKRGYSEEVFERIGKATVESSAWAEYDRGALTDAEVMELFVQNDPVSKRNFGSLLTASRECW